MISRALSKFHRRPFSFMPDTTDLEERRWNHLSETMSSFHSYFKQEFNTIYELADGSFTKRGLSLSLYLEMAKRLNSHLTMHHTIEERHIFPVLAKRMPEFSTETEDAHIDSHKGIHKGLDELSTLVQKFKKEPSTYSPTEMRTCLDGFREVLFTHLDEEVNDLRGENMKKYWTLEELESIPM
ncbi:hemerythrin HHE cation binding domain-containing protein [Mycena epipterygia]|nr:hemerythrin HHE cation binding domain-containing protein [Mycena epipterygia]